MLIIYIIMLIRIEEVMYCSSELCFEVAKTSYLIFFFWRELMTNEIVFVGVFSSCVIYFILNSGAACHIY